MPQLFCCGNFQRGLKLEILFKNKDFIVINKPVNLPSQSDMAGGDNALSETEKALAELSEKPALWLVHRLDRVVGGLLLFARNKEAAALFSKAFAEGKVIKEYLAVVEGEAVGGEMRDYIYKDSLTSRAFVVNTLRRGAKEAVLNYSKKETVDGKTLVGVKLETGRFHQIRVQFSSRKMPLIGDKKYGSKDRGAQFPALFASRLEFEFKEKKYSFSAIPETDTYPWCLFSKESFGV